MMRSMKIVLVVLLVLSLNGCGSRIELNNLIFVFGLYVDAGKEPGTVEVTISTPLPNRLNSGQQSGSVTGESKPYSIVSKSAPTITEALSSIQRDLTRRITLSHIKVVVIGKAYAQKGIKELLEWLKREPGFPLGTFVIASSGPAKEITKLSPIYEQQPSQVLMKMASSNSMVKTTIKDCLFAEASNSGYSLTYFFIRKKEGSIETKNTEYWAGIKGIVIFQGDKMKGTLNIKEAVALAWASDRVKRSLYSATWAGGKGRASAILKDTKASSSISITDKGPVFKIRLKGSASIISIENADDHNDHEFKMVSDMIKDKLEKSISKDVSSAIRKTQVVGADVLHLGLLIEWNDPKLWMKLKDQWEDYYAHKVDIRVSTHVEISDFGAAR